MNPVLSLRFNQTLAGIFFSTRELGMAVSTPLMRSGRTSTTIVSGAGMAGIKSSNSLENDSLSSRRSGILIGVRRKTIVPWSSGSFNFNKQFRRLPANFAAVLSVEASASH